MYKQFLYFTSNVKQLQFVFNCMSVEMCLKLLRQIQFSVLNANHNDLQLIQTQGHIEFCTGFPAVYQSLWQLSLMEGV